MIFRIPELIQHVSSIMTLEEGDLILTGEIFYYFRPKNRRANYNKLFTLPGTPSGVGPVKAGDKVVAGLISKSDGTELASWEGSAEDRNGGYVFKA
jgi:acylpyruvate hydrolase